MSEIAALEARFNKLLSDLPVAQPAQVELPKHLPLVKMTKREWGKVVFDAILVSFFCVATGAVFYLFDPLHALAASALLWIGAGSYSRVMPFQVLADLWRKAGRSRLVDAASALKASGKAPILFLRPFAADQAQELGFDHLRYGIANIEDEIAATDDVQNLSHK